MGAGSETPPSWLASGCFVAIEGEGVGFALDFAVGASVTEELGVGDTLRVLVVALGDDACELVGAGDD